MPSYFISNGSQIVNFILADTKEVAEQVSQMEAILFEDAPEGMNIGWELQDGVWINPNPVAILEPAPEE